MKKSISILFLFIFLFNVFGFWIAFKLRQIQIHAEVRKEVKSALKGSVSENELQVFNVTEGNDLPEKAVWVKKGKEFRLFDNMFDIVRSESKRGELILYCINDKQEEVLFTHLDEHIEKHVANKSKNKSNKVKIEKKGSDFYEVSSNTFLLPAIEVISYFFLTEEINQFFSNRFSPPPELT